MKPVVEALQSIRLFLTENLSLKLGALAISVLMFSLVHGAEDMERSVYVDVVVQPPADAEGMLLVSEIPDRVRLRLRGSRSRLNALRQEALPPVEVRLKSVQDPSFFFEEEQFDLPTGVSVTQVSPSSVDFEWVERAERELPVEISLAGRLPEGLELVEPPEVVPDEVTVEGPRTVIATMRQVRSIELDVSNLPFGITQLEVPLVGPPSLAKFNTQTVLVTLNVQAKMAERLLGAFTIVTEGGDVRTMRPKQVELRVRGPQEIVDSLDPVTVQAVVDLRAVAEQQGSVVMPIEVRGLPDGVEVVDLNPPQIVAQLGT